MDLSKILAVSGKPDLYKHIAQSRNGFIIESLNTGKRMNAFASMRISALQDIAIYTEDEDMPLEDVFRKIYKATDGKKAPSHKASGKEIEAFFDEVLPEYDRDRVYVSDMKRVLKWYNSLHKLGLVDDKAPETEEEQKEEPQNSENEKPADNEDDKQKEDK